MGEGKQKFKLGDRVRRFKGYNRGSEVGHEATISRISALPFDSDGPWLSFTDGTDGYATSFELVEAKWEPKVGDRVRFTDKCPSGWWFGPHTENKEGVIDTDCHPKDDLHNGRFGIRVGDQGYGLVGLEHIEPVTATPSFTIEAGKFYKTRDGRKVGPVKKTADGFKWEGHGEVRWIKPDGKHQFGNTNYDLIAEWVDEPAAQPAVANDNAAPAKFKVGDRVVATESSGGGSIRAGDVVVLTEVDDDFVKYINPNNGRPDGWRATYFKLTTQPTAIVALIENGVAKPSTRPVVHLDQETASKEAERLALLHPSQEFGVFVLADSKIADTVTETVTRTVLRAA